ncbi:MAG: hypothetical protein ACT7A5_24135 [Ferrovibrionaceae bacterium]
MISDAKPCNTFADTGPLSAGSGAAPHDARSGADGDRALCGWRVASAVPLSGLPQWRGDERAPDIVVALDPVPDRLPDLILDQPPVQISADGSCRFAVPDVAAYLIDPAGRHVVIDPVAGASTGDIRIFLLGTVLGILCARRGILPLHAACVQVGDGAVALAGASGMGKSTLAAAFIQQGCRILSDDVTAVEVAGDHRVQVRPSLPRLKLCPDAMDRFMMPAEAADRALRDAGKFIIPVDDHFHPEPLPLTAVVHLRPAPDSMPSTLHRLSGIQGLAAVADDVYRPILTRWLDQADRLARVSFAMAGVPGGSWQLSYRHDADGPEAAVDRILDALAAPVRASSGNPR